MMQGKEITFVTRKEFLYRQWQTPGDEKPVLQVMVPGYLRRQIMQLAHDSILGAYLSTGKTLSRIQAVFFWPDMGGDVALFCRSCDIMPTHHQQGQNTKSCPSEDATDRPTLQESSYGPGWTDFSPKCKRASIELESGGLCDDNYIQKPSHSRGSTLLPWLRHWWICFVGLEFLMKKDCSKTESEKC